MKITKTIKNPDWVRFSYDVNLEVNKFLTAEVEVTGNVSTEFINNKEVKFIDDLECCPTWFIGGKKTKHKEFKELYSKLFEESYEKLEDEIDDLMYKKISSDIPNHISQYSKSDRISFLNTKFNESERVVSSLGVSMLIRTWTVNNLLESLGINPGNSKNFFDKNGESRYGIEESYLRKLVEQITYNCE